MADSEELMRQGNARRADACRSILGTSDFVARAVLYVVRDLQNFPFTEGELMGEEPEGEEGGQFAIKELEKNLQLKLIECIGSGKIVRLVRQEQMMSSSLVALHKEKEMRNRKSFHELEALSSPSRM